MASKGSSPNTDDNPSSRPFKAQTQKLKEFFSIPPPIKKLFDNFPVITYQANDLPLRAPKLERLPMLYVFSTSENARAGKPSFNPSCLKWQTFLKIAGVDHQLVASNNHASPTGVLPFLLPGFTSSTETPLPIPSNKLAKYAAEHGSRVDESPSIRYEAYQSLLDHRIRNAWLYTLYLEPANFDSVAFPLYIHPASSSLLVRKTLSYQLCAAATAELLKHTSIIDIDDLYSEADKAFEALSILLNSSSWFFGNKGPGLFDASVFAYTQLLLDESMGWEETRLGRALRRRKNLVEHRHRMLATYYDE